MGLAERFAREDAEAAARKTGRPKHARPATKADETPEFVAFWETWKRVKSDYDGRAAARDAFFRHVWWKDADPQDIVDGAKFYERHFRTGQFRMLAERWMERGAYEDDAERWRKLVADLEAKRAPQARPANVHVLRQPDDSTTDNRPTEEERARHAQAVLARAGLAAGNGA